MYIQLEGAWNDPHNINWKSWICWAGSSKKIQQDEDIFSWLKKLNQEWAELTADFCLLCGKRKNTSIDKKFKCHWIFNMNYKYQWSAKSFFSLIYLQEVCYSHKPLYSSSHMKIFPYYLISQITYLYNSLNKSFWYADGYRKWFITLLVNVKKTRLFCQN